MTTDDNDDRCGLDPIVTPRWDPYRKRACHPHDAEFDQRKEGDGKNLAQVSAQWALNVGLTAAIGAYAVVTAPLYLVGGLVGGAIRWFQIGPEEDD
jgi:hypothetical protein